MATWKTVTVKSSGGDYASLNAALAGEVTDVTTESGDLVIEVYNFSDIIAVTTTGQSWTTDATHRVIIRTVDNHLGIYSTSVYRLEVSNSSCFINNAIAHLVVDGTQMRYTGSGGAVTVFSQSVNIPGSPGTGIADVFNCIFVMDHTGATDNFLQIVRLKDNVQVHRWRNCLLYSDKVQAGTDNIGMNISGIGIAAFIDNCVIDNVKVGINLASADVRLRNTRITNCTTLRSGGQDLHTGSNYNLSDLAGPTNWGANSIDSGDSPAIGYVDDSNATLTSRDYHLSVDTDSGHEAGTDLSSDTDNPFNDDIDGTARTVPWDIGIHEFSSATALVNLKPKRINNANLNVAQIRGAFF